MNKYCFLFLLFFYSIFQEVSAQNASALPLAGFWKMENSILNFSDSNYLRIYPLQENLCFAKTIINNKPIELSGSIIDNDQVYFIDYSDSTSIVTFKGIWQSGTKIAGKCFQNDSIIGDFTWEKVCDEAGVSLDFNGVPCLEINVDLVTETKMVKKIVQVAEKTAFVGEARNENIPLAETTNDIPANAVLVGHIGLDENVSYKSVEIEVPEEVTVEKITEKENKIKKEVAVKSTSKAKPAVAVEKEKVSRKIVTIENANDNNNSVPESYEGKNTKISSVSENVRKAMKGTKSEVPQSYSSESVAKKPNFASCDTSASNPQEKIAQMVRGTTTEENGHTYHIVGAGETMFSISKLYQVAIPKLAELNNKTCERINAGEKLLIK